jgi:hypothetical protein
MVLPLLRLSVASNALAITALYAYPHDISTSAAVIEFRNLVLLSGLLLLVVGYAHIGFFIAVIGEALQSGSIEATVATYGTIGWILVIEMLLFCGFLVTTYIVLMAVSPIPAPS